jgi:predicted Rossmann fold nucleotide-binding protein DprA/Smf involved in DNA uptake
MELSRDSYALILLCSNLALPVILSSEQTPLTRKEWSGLLARIEASSLQNPGRLIGLSSDALRKALSLTPEEGDRLARLLSRAGSMALELERLEHLGIWVSTPNEEDYPRRLMEVLGERAPPVLYGAGDPSIATIEGLTIVGSRDVDEEGAGFAQELANKAASEGFCLISGGAKGVDILSLRAALEVEGKAISFFPCGLAPLIRKRDVREPILRENLLILSCVHPDAPFSVGNAMGRNRFIYALARFAAVVASAAGEGGTWAGAIENLAHRWVPLFVREEASAPEGNRKLLLRGAIPLPREILTSPEIDLRWFFEEGTRLHWPILGEDIPRVSVDRRCGREVRGGTLISKDPLPLGVESSAHAPEIQIPHQDLPLSPCFPTAALERSEDAKGGHEGDKEQNPSPKKAPKRKKPSGKPSASPLPHAQATLFEEPPPKP